jgi:hypothetical protein
MRLYVIISGIIFALVTAAHVARIFLEPTSLSEPIFMVSSFISLALAVWSIMVLRNKKP